MKIESIKTILGANVYRHQPVTVMHIEPEDLSGKTTRELPGFSRRLLHLLPELEKHPCFCKTGRFSERLNEGTHLNHVIEHIAVEILSQAGLIELEKPFCNGDENDDSKAVIETTAVETTRFVLPAAAEIADAVLNEKSFFIEEKIRRAKEIAADTELGPSTKAIVDAARRRGIPVSRENKNSLIQLGYGKNLRFVQAALTDFTSVIAADIAADKHAAKERLKKFSIPVPYGLIVENEAEAVAALEKIGAPVVVKPLDGRQGKGVSLNIKTAAQITDAFRIAREFSPIVLIEEMFDGKNYRVLVVGGKMVAACERLPCRICGDGARTIAELIELENRNPLRGEGHEKPLTKIKLTQNLLLSLENEGWRLEDIPAEGVCITLCAGINLSTGGTARDVTDEVHKTVRNVCERAARIINLDVCGIDLVLENIAAPMPKKKGGVIELNTAPGLRMHLFPSEGKPRDVGDAIVEMLFPNGRQGRIPIISITGTNGKTTVTRMIAHILRQTGKCIGMTTTDGIFINDEEILRGDTTGPASAGTILGDRAVEIAVLETARGGIVRRGLGFDWADVSVLTNISEDHIGQDGIESVEDLINIKALIAERVRPGGTLVLNADDSNVLQILEREKVREIPKQIVYFSLDENNAVLQFHLARNGLAFFEKDGFLVEARGESRRRLLKTDSIPAMMHGLADFQIANVLAAIAVCRALDVPINCLESLKNFKNEANNPGRNNLYRIGRGYALIDYGHNAEAFAAVCRMAARWKDKTVTGIIGVPGDRDDHVMEEAARIAARGFQHIIIKEDADLRGRQKGEVARILYDAARREAPESICEIVLNEAEAFRKALDEIKESEVVIIFYDKLAPIMEILSEHKAVPVSDFETAAPFNAPAPAFDFLEGRKFF